MDAGKLIKEEFIKIGDNIRKNTGNQIGYYISTAEEYDEIKEVTFHLIAEEISYDYTVFIVTMMDVQTVSLDYYTMVTNQKQTNIIKMDNALHVFKEKVHRYIQGGLFKASIESLLNQIQLRRENRLPMRQAIIPGQACVAVFRNKGQQNVGWIRIENETTVYYYTAQGLRDIWRPGMTAEEKENAEKLKKESERSLIDTGYISTIDINDILEIS